MVHADVAEAAGHMVSVLALDLWWTAAARLAAERTASPTTDAPAFDLPALLTGERGGCGLVGLRSYYRHFLQRRAAAVLAVTGDTREPIWPASEQDSHRPEAAWTVVHQIVTAVEAWQPALPGAIDPVERYSSHIDGLARPVLPLLRALRASDSPPPGLDARDESAARWLIFGASSKDTFRRLLDHRRWLLPCDRDWLLPAVPRVTEPGFLGVKPDEQDLDVTTVLPSGDAGEVFPPTAPVRSRAAEPLVAEERKLTGFEVLPPLARGSRVWDEPAALSGTARLASSAFAWLSGHGDIGGRVAFTAHHLLRGNDGTITPIGYLSPEPVSPEIPAAFLRRHRTHDGSDSLIRREVPSSYGPAWSLGVALADHQGFADSASELGSAWLTAPARGSRILAGDVRRELLALFYRRISGTHASRRLAPELPGGCVPALVWRNVRRLERAGRAPDDRLRLLFHLLLSEIEGTALRIRVDEPDITLPGAACWTLASVARAVAPARPDALTDVGIRESRRTPKRRHSWAYWCLAERVRSLVGSAVTAEDSADQADLSAFEAGLRVLMLQAELRGLVVEAISPGAGPSLAELSRDPPPLGGLGLSADALLVQTDDNTSDDATGGGPVGPGLVLARLAAAVGMDSPRAPEFGDSLEQPHWRREAALAQITAVGWCYALAALTGLLSPTSPRLITLAHAGSVEPGETLAKLKALAAALTTPASRGEEVDLPWGDLAPAARAVLDGEAAALAALREIEAMAGITVTLVRDGIRAPTEGSTPGFYQVCASDRDYSLPAWCRGAAALDAVSGHRSPLEYSLDVATRSHRYVWSESRREGSLVGIGVIDLAFSRFLNGGTVGNAAEDGGSPEPSVGRAPLPVAGTDVPGDAAAGPLQNVHTASDTASGEDSSPTMPVSGGADPVADGGVPDAAAPPVAASPSRDRQTVRAEQTSAWRQRVRFPEERATKLRIAFAQFDVDDSYRHPIFEVCTGALAGSTNHGEAAAVRDAQAGRFESIDKFIGGTLPSCAEARRQNLMTEIFRACEAFAVDALLLPEYSLRPDTVAWIQRTFPARSFDLLAGTFRVPPHYSWPSGSPSFSDLPGDWDSVAVYLPSRVRPGAAKPGFRRKLLPAVALGEIFRPTSNGEPVTLPSPGAASDFLDPARRCIALICAELFLTTNPATLPPAVLADKRLRRLFGGANGSPPEKHLADMVAQLGEELSVLKGANRRSVVLVPALTTRAADYWFAAQSGVLSAGLVTVMSNATKRSHGCGQSFLAGAGSWTSRADSPAGMPQGGPYLGPRPGLLNPSRVRDMGALSEDEQAVVIADVDPIHTLDSRPTVQVPLLPVEFVAHLPIFEAGRIRARGVPVPLGDESRLKCRCGREDPSSSAGGEEVLAKLESALRRQHENGFSWSEETLLIAERANRVEPGWQSLRDRLVAAKAHHLADRAGQPPPSAVDFLWVQARQGPHATADIVVPPYAEVPGGGAPILAGAGAGEESAEESSANSGGNQ